MNALLAFCCPRRTVPAPPPPEPAQQVEPSVCITRGDTIFLYHYSVIPYLGRDELRRWRRDLIQRTTDSYDVHEIETINLFLEAIATRLTT